MVGMAGSSVSQTWFQPTGSWGWISGPLADRLKTSQSWYWPAGEQVQGLGCPRAGASLLVSEISILEFSRLYPSTGEYCLVLGLVYAHCLVEPGPGVPGRTIVELLVSEAEAQGVPGLVLAHCWVELGPKFSSAVPWGS